MLTATRFTGLITYLTLALSAAPVQAAYNTWDQTGPSSGRVWKLSIASTDGLRQYAITTGGVFRSTDGGLNWTRVHDGQVNGYESLAVDPTDADRVYVIGSSGTLLSSSDGGANFTSRTILNTGFHAHEVAADADGLTLYASAVGGGVAVSNDRGATWVARNSGLPSMGGFIAYGDLWTDPARPGLVFLATPSDGLFRSTDSGLNWSSVASVPVGTNVRSMSFSRDDPAKVMLTLGTTLYRSADDGATFATVTALPQFSVVALDQTDPMAVYAGDVVGSLRRSTDGGTTWTDQQHAGLIQGVTALDARGGRVVVGTTHGVILSTDSAASFTTTAGIHTGDATLFYQDPDTPSRWFVGFESDGLYRSDDAGAHWTRAQSGIQRPEDAWNISVYALVRSADGRLYAAGRSMGILSSDDHGASWSQVGSAFRMTSGTITVQALAAHPTQALTLWAATSQGLHRTTDGGLNWTAMGSSGLATGYIFSVTVSPHDGNLVLANSMLSRDGGVTWNSLPVNAEGHAFDPTDPAVIYAYYSMGNFGPPHYHVSRDAGVTWAPLSTRLSDGGRGIGLPAQGGAQILVDAQGGADLTVDAGASFTLLRDGLSVREAQGAQFVHTDRADRTRHFLAPWSGGLKVWSGSPDLALSAGTAAATVTEGGVVALPYGIVNQSGYPATGVTLAVTLPSGTRLTGASGATCDGTEGTVACDVGTLPANAAVTVTLSVEGSTLGQKTIQANVELSETDLVPGNGQAQHTVTVEQRRGPDLSVSLTGGAASIQVGKSLTLSFTVTNSGPDAATASSFTLQVPALLKAGAVKLTKVTGVKGMKCTKGTLVSCTFGALPVGQTRRGTITLKAGKVAGTATLIATAAGSPTDPDASDNSTTRTFTITPKP